MHRPDADLRQTAPTDAARQVRRPLQQSPPAPVPPATTARPQHTGPRAAHRAGAAPEGPRRRDQRVLQSRIGGSTNPHVRQYATSFGPVQAVPSADHPTLSRDRHTRWSSHPPARTATLDTPDPKLLAGVRYLLRLDP